MVDRGFLRSTETDRGKEEEEVDFLAVACSFFSFLLQRYCTISVSPSLHFIVSTSCFRRVGWIDEGKRKEVHWP